MICKKYQLDNSVKEITRDIELWESDKGRIAANKGTLAIQLRIGKRRRGHVFQGHGELILDTIVETKEGAVGKPVEEELSQPFLMIGNERETEEHLIGASGEAIARLGYKSQAEFIERAEALCRLFFGGRIHDCRSFDGSEGVVFAFQGEARKLDILISDRSELIYKTSKLVFVSDDREVVLKSPNATVCSSDGESVIIRNGKSFIIEE